MKDFKGKIAVITGAGSGIGRELACQLASEGCHVAFSEFIVENMNETERLCQEIAPPGTRITAYECDVSNEAQVITFRDAVKEQHHTDHINFLFNNAGVGHSISFIKGDRQTWDRVFNIDWFGVYYNTRAFMPLLLASTEGHIINTSSVNAIWACLSADMPSTAYCAAKFAVRGFTEALQVDLRLNAPHIKAHLVMPGGVSSSIIINAVKILDFPEIGDISAVDPATLRKQATHLSLPVDAMGDEQLRETIRQYNEGFLKYDEYFRRIFRLSPAQAASIILEGVRNEQWRILVGKDAKIIDQVARTDPEKIYEPGFMEKNFKVSILPSSS
jgi:NAD(P)-dependent dehydrogenase (short-subunit alcohol dehydrogenase family)